MLAVMLRDAGLKVELATLGVLRRRAGDRGGAVAVGHARHPVASRSTARQHWIDTTAQPGRLGLPAARRPRPPLLPRRRARARSASAGRRPRRRRATAASSRRPTCGSAPTARRGASGRCVSYGSAALGQRDTFLEVPAGERRRQVTSELQDANSRSRLGHLTLDEAALRDLDRPVTVRMTYEISSLFSGTPDREGIVHRQQGLGQVPRLQPRL